MEILIYSILYLAEFLVSCQFSITLLFPTLSPSCKGVGKIAAQGVEKIGKFSNFTPLQPTLSFALDHDLFCTADYYWELPGSASGLHQVYKLLHWLPQALECPTGAN